MTQNAKLVFRLGNLVVYSMEAEPTFIRPSGGQVYYYWKNPAHPNGFGPFHSVYECVKHYETFVNEINNLNKNPDAKVIEVDFKSKAKVIPFIPK